MIFIVRTDKPAELTETLQKQLTERFKSTGESVWNLDFLKEALLRMSHNKCAYSECKLQTEGKFMEVEHYLPKEKYKDAVLEWENLLPANKKCNGTKGAHDTRAEPIINPCTDIPKEHLILKKYRFYHKTELGKNTIAVTAINDREHFVTPRFEIGVRVEEKLEELLEYFEAYASGKDDSSIRLRNKINALLAILTEAKPEYEYSATVATVVIHNTHYHRIREILQTSGKWAAELNTLDAHLADAAFDEN